MAKQKEKETVVKKDEVALAMEKLNKDYGKGTVMGALDKGQVIEAISTGSIGLDAALGIGGVPRGRVIEIYGPESSGKTTLALTIIAEAMKDPEARCAAVDMEHALDLKYAAALGVDLKRLLISQPDYGEQGLEVVDALTATGKISVIVVDSVAALVPKSEIDRNMGDSSMGKQAMLMSQACRKLVPMAEKTGTTLIFINQLREKIGVMFGNPETTTGGNALKFYSSIRLDIRKKSTNKDGDDEAVSNTVKVKIVKNKVAPPFKSAEFDIIYGHGIDKFKEVIEIAVELKIVAKSGSWYSYNDTKLGQGLDSVISVLEDNIELYDEIHTKVLENLSNLKLPVEPVVESEEQEEITNITELIKTGEVLLQEKESINAE